MAQRTRNTENEPGPAGTNGTTTTESVSVPSEVKAGDAPFDTADPSERVTSVDSPDKDAAAQAGFGTVNAVLPLPKVETPAVEKGEDRIEEYDAIGPDGKPVRIRHNLDTGVTERI